MEQSNENTKKQLADFLPAALDRVIASYHRYMEQDPAKEAKPFLEYHRAGQAAIAHINLLLKLEHWAASDPPEQNEAFLDAFILAGEGFARYRADAEDENDSH